MVGFRDLQSFNKAFRRVYGMPPTAARHGVMGQSNDADHARR
jgi:AraC-like DNA-binding protein